MIEVGDLVSYKKHFSVQTPGFSARCGFVCAAIENKRTVISSPLHQREVKVVWLDGATSWEGEGFLDKIKGVKEMSAFTRKFFSWRLGLVGDREQKRVCSFSCS